MSDVKIITNNHHRDIIDASQLTEKEQEEFDYLNWEAIKDGRDSASFFRYRGDLYDLGTFTRCDAPGWDGCQADSFFSATLVRYVDDFECVVVALMLS